MVNIRYLTECDIKEVAEPSIPTSSRFLDLRGTDFGDLKVITYRGKRGKLHLWGCECSCGIFIEKSTDYLRLNRVKSKCFKCVRREATSKEWGNILMKFKNAHGEKYDYSDVNYINTKTKISITCPIHGNFKQTPEGHLLTEGCRDCGRLKANTPHRNDFEVFLERSTETHEDRYDYSSVEYISSCKKVQIICKEHGSFEQIPKSHWNGRGCPVCRYISAAASLRYSFEEFEEKANTVHDGRYSYDKVSYFDTKTLTKITCKLHGEFEQRPTTHLQGFGCGGCSTRGYNTEGGGWFYLISLNGEFIKYGITGKSPEKRLTQQAAHSRFYHEIIDSFFFEDGQIPKRIESAVRLEVGGKVLTKECLPDGYTETCNYEDLGKILKIVEDFKGGFR